MKVLYSEIKLDMIASVVFGGVSRFMRNIVWISKRRLNSPVLFITSLTAVDCKNG